MAEGKKSNKSKKTRKYNRDRIKCARYAAEHRRTSRSLSMNNACGATVVATRWPLATLGSAKSNAWNTS